ncbi:LysE family translocator [Fodinicola feengrottensis]|uniref:LysE family translocator n=1 Tax=Fodinicola feengrottensis TaxID=435914 RepID=A0ABN2HND1_9ACTN|nr:LysE family translocator [Fodinicola feengrottensis]
MQWRHILGFALAVLPICLTPGASFSLVTQRVSTGRRQDGLMVTFGTVTGLFVHATLAAAGLSTLVMRSSEAFTVVKIGGAGYLVGLGCWTLWSTRRRKSAASHPATPKRSRLPWSGHHPYVQGLLSNVLNPKAASVYLTLVPQFLNPQRPIAVQIALLALAHAAVVIGWLTGWTFVVSAAKRVLTASWFKTGMTRVTATVLIALGVRAAVTD